MSIKDAIIAPKDHIIDARSMAASIFRKSPEVQLEMIAEINKHLIKLHENTVEQLRQQSAN